MLHLQLQAKDMQPEVAKLVEELSVIPYLEIQCSIHLDTKG